MSLFDLAPREMTPASMEAWELVLRDLAAREAAVLDALYAYLDRTGYEDCTGGELAAVMGLPTTSVRPRLSMLHDAGLLMRGASRKSRAPMELRAHGYRPVLPRQAWIRARHTQESEGNRAKVGGAAGAETPAAPNQYSANREAAPHG